jgi:hypothetical protein
MKKSNPVEFARAIGDATRQQIMGLCCCEWLSVNEIVERTSVSQPTVSHHLAILRASRGQADLLHFESGSCGVVLRTNHAGVCAGDQSHRSRQEDRRGSLADRGWNQLPVYFG